MVNPKKEKYHILSPDGFAITPEPFASEKEAEDFVPKWCERYRQQGYYSRSDRERIPVNELPEHVEIVSESELAGRGVDAEAKMKKLGHHLRLGSEKQPIDSERNLTTFREALREQLQKEQQASRNKPSAPESEKTKDREPEEPDLEP